MIGRMHEKRAMIGITLLVSVCGMAGEADVREAWARVYDGPGHGYDSVSGLAIDASGAAYLIGGQTNARNDADCVVIKYAANGSTLWSAVYNSGFDDGFGAKGSIGAAIAVDGQGYVYATAMSYGGRNHYYDFATIKYDPNGKELWVARYDGPAHGLDTPGSIAVDAEGNVYVTGTCERPYPFYQDIATVKYDKDGRQQWVAWYHGPGYRDYGLYVRLHKSGNVVIVGSTGLGHNLEVPVTLMYSPDGALMWEQVGEGGFGGVGRPFGAEMDESGNVYVVGAKVVKYNADGQLLWERSLFWRSTLAIGTARGLAVDRIGNAHIVEGNATSKYSPEGDLLWRSKFWQPQDSFFMRRASSWDSIALDAAGNVYVGGAYGGMWSDSGVAKYDSEGRELWRISYPGHPVAKESRKPDSVFHGMAVTPDGCIYVVGETKTGRLVDWVTIKYEQTP